MNCWIIQACSKCVWHTERELGTRFHGWNVPAGIPNGCKGSVWSSGRKWTLGGGEGESGSWIVSCCLLAFLSTSFGSTVLFSKKALPIRQVTHCSPSFALSLFLSSKSTIPPPASTSKTHQLLAKKLCQKHLYSGALQKHKVPPNHSPRNPSQSLHILELAASLCIQSQAVTQVFCPVAIREK